MDGAVDPRSSRVLVVDDDEAKRYTIVRPLKAAGLEVLEAATGHQGLELARSDPDLILLDVRLPDLSGHEVCRRLKADPVTAGIPVLHVSASKKTTEDRIEGLSQGADGYLVAPVHAAELLATVRVWLRARAAERERQRLLTELERQRILLTQVVEQLPVAVVLASPPGGAVVLCNPKARKLFPALRMPGVSMAQAVRLLRGGAPLPIPEYPIQRALGGVQVPGEELEIASETGPNQTVMASAAPIHDAHGRVVAAVAAIVDITDRKHAEEQAREVGRFREELIGILGHDMRNPLQAVSIGLSVLGQARLEDRAMRSLSRIRSSVERMMRMVEDMLDFASARLGGGIQVRPSPIELRAVVVDAVDELRTANPGRQVRLEGPSELRGRWDADRMAQVISNLVGNAIQHSPPEEPITVRLGADEGVVQLEVHNGGAPIPNEQLGHIFGAFKRGTNPNGTRGVGLGLYITNQIVLAHGGQLQVESTEHSGTRFRVTLPAAPSS